MSVWEMPSGVLVETHEGFTVRHAGTAFEVHGTEGSICARGVMTQRPVGEIVLRVGDDERVIGFNEHNLYERGIRRFMDAVNGTGSPSATGIDGIKSLAVALAAKEAAASGRRVAIDYGGV